MAEDKVKAALDAANLAEFLGNQKLAEMAMEQLRVEQEREAAAFKAREVVTVPSVTKVKDVTN